MWQPCSDFWMCQIASTPSCQVRKQSWWGRQGCFSHLIFSCGSSRKTFGAVGDLGNSPEMTFSHSRNLHTVFLDPTSRWFVLSSSLTFGCSGIMPSSSTSPWWEGTRLHRCSYPQLVPMASPLNPTHQADFDSGCFWNCSRIAEWTYLCGKPSNTFGIAFGYCSSLYTVWYLPSCCQMNSLH